MVREGAVLLRVQNLRGQEIKPSSERNREEGGKEVGREGRREDGLTSNMAAEGSPPRIDDPNLSTSSKRNKGSGVPVQRGMFVTFGAYFLHGFSSIPSESPSRPFPSALLLPLPSPLFAPTCFFHTLQDISR